MENPYSAPIVTGNEVPQYSSAQAGQITQEMIEALRQTRPWVLFLAILGFVGCGVFFLVGIAVMSMSALPGIPQQDFPTGALGLIYWILIPFYLVPSLKLMNYARSIQKLMSGGGAPALQEALVQQKSFWKLVGIFTLVMMVLYALAIFGAIVVGMASAF